MVALYLVSLADYNFPNFFVSLPYLWGLEKEGQAAPENASQQACYTVC